MRVFYYAKNWPGVSEEEWTKTININLAGTFLFCESSPVYGEKQLWGHKQCYFWWGKMGFPKLSAYRSSKFGIIGLSESAAAAEVEVDDYGIRIMTYALVRFTRMWMMPLSWATVCVAKRMKCTNLRMLPKRFLT
jgi:NAD(P)-dependent dehydrogenase (short-subunit alcohol dehydrogenase family)